MPKKLYKKSEKISIERSPYSTFVGLVITTIITAILLVISGGTFNISSGSKEISLIVASTAIASMGIISVIMFNFLPYAGNIHKKLSEEAKERKKMISAEIKDSEVEPDKIKEKLEKIKIIEKYVPDIIGLLQLALSLFTISIIMACVYLFMEDTLTSASITVYTAMLITFSLGLLNIASVIIHVFVITPLIFSGNKK